MAKKDDIKRLEAVAKEFGMDPEQRREFGDYVEECKRHGDMGPGARGDFDYNGLKEKAKEYLGE